MPIPLTGTKLATPARIKAVGCSTSICAYFIYIGTPSTPLPSGNLSDIAASCIQTPLASNTEKVVCSMNSKSGVSYAYNLSIYSQGAVSQVSACSQQITTSNGGLQCTVGNTNNTSYNWILNVYVKNVGWV